jgi:transcriptional regulator with XRE-family HTH domain
MRRREPSQLPEPKIEAQIGLEVKRLRRAAKLTVRALATRAAFSASFISQLENGQVAPSIGSLNKIAATLNTTVRQLFASSPMVNGRVVRADERPSFHSAWSRGQISALSPTRQPGYPEALMMTLEPGGESSKSPTPFHYNQLAIIFVGRLELTLGSEMLTVRRGDAIQIPAGTPHRWYNDRRRPAQAILVSASSPS